MCGDVRYALSFLIGFIPQRIYIGGYHATSHTRCYLAFSGLALICILLSKAIAANHLFRIPDIVNDAVAELIKKIVTSPDFEKGIREKIAARVDTSELEQELDGLKKKMRQLEVSKDKIAIQMDNLDVTDSMYEKKYDDLQKRFYDKYDEMALTENHMDEIQSRLAHIRRKQLSGDRIYNFLIAFDKLYDKLSDAEKKEFMGTFVESIELYPERLENGKFLKHIHFRFPVYYNGTVIDDISWENESTVETVVLLSKIKK